MSNKTTPDLEHLRTHLREILMSVTDEVNKIGDAIYLADFSFVISKIVLRVDFGENAKNAIAESSRKLVYECFSNNREFVDESILKLEANNQEYLQSLYSQGLVYLWARLESLIRQLIVTLIGFNSAMLSANSFKKINISMSEFFRLDDDEKDSYLTDLIISNLDCRDNLGVERFECYLDAFGLTGPFDNEHKKRILALHQIRNCLVHSDAKADLRLCKRCDWLGYHVGDKIVITGDDFRAYERSVLAYIQEVYYRIHRKLGAPEEFLNTLRNMLDEIHRPRPWQTKIE